MALSVNTVFEVRPTNGNDANGGGFVTGASGTDYSQQNGAQYNLTGLTSVGAGSVLLSASAAAVMVGNIAKSVSGTNVVTGRFQIISVVVGVSITFDRAITTGVGASGVLNIGGAVQTLAELTAAAVLGGCDVYIKAEATVTVTTTNSLPDVTAAANRVRFIGYTTTRTDNGRVTWTTATNSTVLFTLASSGNKHYFWTNFNFTSTAGTKAAAIATSGSVTVTQFALTNCVFDGLDRALDLRGGSLIYLHKCNIKNMVNDGIRVGTVNSGCSLTLNECWIHDNTGDGVESGGSSCVLTIRRCGICNNGGHGVNIIEQASGVMDHMVQFFESGFINNTNAGVDFTDTSNPVGGIIANCVFWSNGTYGLHAGIAPTLLMLRSNAFGDNTTAATLNITLAGDEVTLTADPFTDFANGDFTLNNTAGGGAALKGVGTPTSIP